MNCSLGLLPSAKALPSSSSFIPHKPRFLPPLTITSKITANYQSKKILNQIDRKPTINSLFLKKSGFAIQIGALLTTFAEQPALAVSGIRDIGELSWTLALTGLDSEEQLARLAIQWGIVAFWYFLIMPPVIMNWLRLRWFKRKFLEMYFQFMFVFIFFPGLMIWAPFINFRPLPVDPRMKYPWTVIQEDSPDSTTSNSP